MFTTLNTKFGMTRSHFITSKLLAMISQPTMLATFCIKAPLFNIGGGSSESFSQHPYTELPVALVHAGCNTADHALTLRQLLHHLKMNCSPHLAVRPAPT